MDTTGVIFDLKRFAVHDGPGIRTTVFLKGCPLRCPWCHNPESMSSDPEFMEGIGRRYCGSMASSTTNGYVGREVTVAEVLAEVEKDIVFYEESGGGVTFSGGEPLNHADFLESALKGCRERGIHTAIDTAGHARWDDFERILPWVDLFLYDLKLMDDLKHREHVGVTNRVIHRNLTRLHDLGANIHIRVPLIPGMTDTDDNLDQIKDFVGRLDHIKKVHLLPYNPMGEGKRQRLRNTNGVHALQTQSEEALDGMKGRFTSLGVNVTIGG